MDICTGYFFSCSTTEYLLLLRVLMNLEVSSPLTIFFLCGSSARAYFPFLFFSALAKSFGWCTRHGSGHSSEFQHLFSSASPYD